MLFFVLGLPGGFAEWCSAVTAALARRAAEPAARIEADTLCEVAIKTIEVGAAQAVVESRRPGGRLRAALVEARRTFVVALDDPRAALLELVLGRGVDLAEAVRVLASSCAALTSYRELPGALVLRAGRDRPQPAATAAAIARHLGIALDDDAIIDAVAEVGADQAALLEDDAIAWWSGLDRAQREMATGALTPYLDPGAAGGELSITWTGDLFPACDRPGERASGPIDITGRARRVIEGPGIMLPPGSWSLALNLFCTREAAEHEFLVEVAADVPIAAGTFRPPAEGSAAFDLRFAIDELTEAPVAIRVSTVRAAFDGAVSLIGATVVRAKASDAG